MARSRNIKPGFFNNELLAECSAHARLLFIGLWQLADRDGLVEDRPRRIKAMLFPFEDVDAEDCLVQLAARKFISRYESDGAQVIYIPEFKKHQKPHRNELPSGLPKPDSGKGANRSGKKQNRKNSRTVREKNRSLMNDERGMMNDGSGIPLSSDSDAPKSPDLDTALWIFSKVLLLHPKHKPPKFDDWARDVRLMREQDGHDDSIIREMYSWVASDDFWRANILSPGKLREKWDTLQAKRNANAQRPGQSKINASAGQQYREGGPRAADHGKF